MALPEGLTREHVLQAIAQLDAGASHEFGASKEYDLVVDGKRYPPKAALGLAAAIATGMKFGPSDFSAGESPGQANAVLRSLGFEIESKDNPFGRVDRATEMGAIRPVHDPVVFTATDCEIFAKYASGSPWNDVDPTNQERFKDLRSRLKGLAQQLAPVAIRLGIPVSSVASQTSPNGRVAGQMWSCVFPNTVSNKSFALQFAVIVNAAGAEICCCLGSGTSQETEVETLKQLQQAWNALRKALAAVPVDLREALERRLGEHWQLRRSWLLEPDRSDFSSLADWLAYASSDQGAGASISRNLSPDELELEGDHFVDNLAADIETFAPLFRYVYSSEQTSPSVSSTAAPVPPSLVHPKLWQELTDLREQLTAGGELHSLEALSGYYATFRSRFGPEVLRAADGEALLSLMHETTKDGLVYWLEFKDDDEFPAMFGSISGGSALKFGLYRRRETRAWMTGTSTAQRELSTAEAIKMARAHRDQLLEADELLSHLPTNAVDAAYQQLQADLARVAPDVQDSAWGHKYLSLLHPDKLDDFHAPAYQRFHLIKMLREPVDAQGRYLNAAKFVELGRLFSWPLNHLTTVLNRRNGSPHRYWRIGTTGDGDQSYWDLMRDQSVVAIGWQPIGDLSAALADETFKEKVRGLLASNYTAIPQAIGRAAQQIAHFCQTMQERDYVVAAMAQPCSVSVG